MRVLLPDLEVNASPGVVLLPTELRIERVGAVREPENTLVHVNHLLLLLPRPIDVDAQRRSAPEGPVVLIQVEDREVVLSLLHEEVVIAEVHFRSKIGLLSVLFVGPTHDLVTCLIILRGHDAQAELNLGKAIGDLGPVAIYFANDSDLLLGVVKRDLIIFTRRCLCRARPIVNSLESVRS